MNYLNSILKLPCTWCRIVASNQIFLWILEVDLFCDSPFMPPSVALSRSYLPDNCSTNLTNKYYLYPKPNLSVVVSVVLSWLPEAPKLCPFLCSHRTCTFYLIYVLTCMLPDPQLSASGKQNPYTSITVKFVNQVIIFFTTHNLCFAKGSNYSIKST